MIIHLDNGIRIHGTENCWQLERLRTKRGKPMWEPFKYFTTFRHALAAAGEREIRTHPAYGLVEAIEAAHGVAAHYGELLDDAFEEISKRCQARIRLAS